MGCPLPSTRVSVERGSGWQKTVSEAVGDLGSNFMLLKGPTSHGRSTVVPLIPAVLLSESTMRLIREGLMLIVIDVSEPPITPKTPRIYTVWRLSEAMG